MPVAAPPKSLGSDPAVQSLAWVGLFYVGNLSINFYNKWLFGNVFKLPLLVTMSQQLFFLFFTIGLTYTSMYKRTPLTSRKLWTQVILIPVVFAANIGMNNFSFKYITLSANALIRSANPVIVAVLSVFILSKSYSRAEVASLGLLVAGVVLAVVNSPEFHLFGTILCLASTAFSALWSVLVAKALTDESGVKLLPFDIMLYCSVPIILLLAVPVQLVGEYEGLVEYVEKDGMLYIGTLVCISGALAWFYCLIVFNFFRRTSALYVSVAAAFKIVPLLVFGAIFFGEQVGLINGFGMFLAVCGFSWIVHHFSEKTRK